MKIIKQIADYIKATKYNIGFVREDLQSVVNGAPIHVDWLKHSYKDRWFADSFILDVTDDEIIVLVEEWYDPNTISLLYEQAVKYDADMVYGSYRRIEQFDGEEKKEDYCYQRQVFLQENEFANRVYSDYGFLQANTWNFLIKKRNILEEQYPS